MCFGGKKNETKQEIVENTSNMVPERKVILVGDSAVGKSAIIHQYILNAYGNLKPTIGVKN